MILKSKHILLSVSVILTVGCAGENEGASRFSTSAQTNTYKGEQGEQGLRGEQGIQGERGLQGVKGVKGDKGEQGLQGVKGDQGIQGLQGANGIDGKNGIDGASGINGIDGRNGVDGINGTNGANGKDGQDGNSTIIASGLPIPTNGKDGDSYFDSLTANFYKKVSGAWQYIINLVGPKGDTGAAGANGINGTNGANGSNGTDGISATVTIGSVTTGAGGTSASVTNSGTATSAVLNFVIPQGAIGPKGSDGSAASVTVGTVTTGAAGSAAAVTNSGTANAAVLNFAIPQGAKGDTGPQGPQGASGATLNISCPAGQMLSGISNGVAICRRPFVEFNEVTLSFAVYHDNVFPAIFVADSSWTVCYLSGDIGGGNFNWTQYLRLYRNASNGYWYVELAERNGWQDDSTQKMRFICAR